MFRAQPGGECGCTIWPIGKRQLTGTRPPVSRGGAAQLVALSAGGDAVGEAIAREDTVGDHEDGSLHLVKHSFGAFVHHLSSGFRLTNDRSKNQVHLEIGNLLLVQQGVGNLAPPPQE